MTPDAADWIYRHVLTTAYRRSVGAEGRGKDDELQLGFAAVRTCPCQFGPCGRCALGRHDHCSHHNWRPPASPLAHILTRRGGALTPVWPTGKACAWRCPCGCLPPEPLPAVEPEPVVEQLELFALAGGAR